MGEYSLRLWRTSRNRPTEYLASSPSFTSLYSGAHLRRLDSHAQRPYPAGAGSIMLPMLPPDYAQTIVFSGGVNPEREDWNQVSCLPLLLLLPECLTRRGTALRRTNGRLSKLLLLRRSSESLLSPMIPNGPTTTIFLKDVQWVRIDPVIERKLHSYSSQLRTLHRQSHSTSRSTHSPT